MKSMHPFKSYWAEKNNKNCRKKAITQQNLNEINASIQKLLSGNEKYDNDTDDNDAKWRERTT